MKKSLLSSMLLMIFAIGFIASDEKDEPGGGGGSGSSAPTIQILAPSSEGTFSTEESKITISGVAKDDTGLISITYKSSGGAQGTADGLENWTITDLPLVNGVNTVTVTAKDKDNNVKNAVIVITKNQNVTFLNIPTVDNNVLFAGMSSQLWITVGIAPNPNLIQNSVALVEVDENNNVINELGQLFDDGNLENGDEIKGDNVFSMKCNLTLESIGNHNFRIVAKTQEESGEAVGYSAVFTLTVIDKPDAEKKVEEVMTFHETADAKLQEIVDQNPEPAKKEALVTEWLQKQSQIASVSKEGDALKLEYKSGMVSYVMLSESNNIKGGLASNDDRYKKPAVPLSMQTRGTWEQKFTQAPSYRRASSTLSENIIQNKNVLIWAPFENSFSQDMEPALSPIFKKSKVGLHVDCLKNEECNTASLTGLAKYGIVVFDTHGHGGNLILTREKAGKFANLIGKDNYNEFIYQYVSSSYYLVTLEYYNEDLKKDVTETFYAVTPKFIKDKVKGTLPNTVIFNGSCESSQTSALSDAFIAKGAKTYLGFKETVLTSTCIDKAKEFFTSLVGEKLETTGKSYVADINFTENDGKDSWLNSYLMTGNKEMKFHLGLINGDFEYGNLNGWTVSGDGRVITKLGPLTPTQGNYMGIISTGLGYTTDYGSIWQTFNVTNETTLHFKWNFLSEEFMEYVGSQYQDYFKVTIKCGDESEVIFEKNVDIFAANYPVASNSVSPEIVFDKNGVYMTGWQTSTLDIKKYQGKTITLLFESGDVGDSIFDSVTLLDEISVY